MANTTQTCSSTTTTTPFHPPSPSPPSAAASPSPSKSSSVSGFIINNNFPSSIRLGISQHTQPNAHPYAIKTTSTALLSRSTSSNAQSATVVHRCIPLSASPSSPSPSSPFHHHHRDGYDGEDDDGEGSMGSTSMLDRVGIVKHPGIGIAGV